MTDRSGPEIPLTLSLEAERAIRTYMLRLVLPTGTVLVVVSFIMGFLIQHGAQNEAAKEAFKAANDVMLDGVQSIATAKATASNVSQELQSIQREAQRISDQLRTTDAFTKPGDLVVKVAETIAARPDFSSKVSAIPGEVNSLRLRIQSLEANLKSAPHLELPSTGGNSRTSSCPSGAYMIGARIQSDSGGPHGIISSIVPICKSVLPP